MKYKDPRCPTILVVIGEHCIDRALLDLRESVNLLPYSVYTQLELGELKPTHITLSLAEKSIKVPREIIEDVLMQVNIFYFLVDFVVTDTAPGTKGHNHVYYIRKIIPCCLKLFDQL